MPKIEYVPPNNQSSHVMVIIREEVFIKGLPQSLSDFFLTENTFRNPKIDSLERLGKWTGNEPKNICLCRRIDDWIALPRGYWGEARKHIEDFGLDANVLFAHPPLRPLPKISPTGELFSYQSAALDDLIKQPTGVMEAPTGSGKSNIILTLITKIAVPTLIVVHTSELLDQTAKRCKAWLNYDPGIIGGGKSIVKDITIGMVQTLSRYNVTKGNPLYDRFGCVIADECHHIPALTWADVIRRLPYKYKYGFSATAWRKDKLDFVIWRMIGPITSKVYYQDVADAGRIVWPEIKFIPTNYFYDIQDSSEWSQMITDLTSDPERNLLIARTVTNYLGQYPSAKALILTDRIEHADTLAMMGKSMNPVVLTGALKKKARVEAMGKIRDGARLTIATIHLLGEGVDVPGWSLLFLASPFAGGPRVLQAVGRVARPAPGKDKALLLDFVDSRVSMLAGAAKARARLYKSRGE